MYSQEQRQYFPIYFNALLYTSLSALVAYPLERIRFELQTHFTQPPRQVAKSFLNGHYNRLYTGMTPFYIKQLAKSSNRAFSLAHVSTWTDKYHFDFFTRSAISSLLVGGIDVTTTIALDNTRGAHIWRSQQIPLGSQKVSIVDTVMTMAQQHGAKRFLHGAPLAMAESSLTWFYFLMACHYTQDVRKQHDIFSTLLWATLIATPHVSMAMPFETLRNRKQSLVPELQPTELKLEKLKNIVSQFGIAALWRGGCLRLAQKILTTGVGLVVVDTSQTYLSNRIQDDSKGSIKPS